MADELFDLYAKNVPGFKFDFDKLNFFYRIFLLANQPDDTPMMIYLGNGPINRLDNVRFSTDETQYLNDKGLHIYLWEPLCIYRDDNSYNQGFYCEFETNQIDDKYKARELDSISYFAYQNNLTNITVHTCDYNCEKYFTYYQNLKFKCTDLFLRSFVMFDNIIKDKPEIDRKFLCLNWRYTKSRHLTMLHLLNKSGYYSWYFDISKENLQNNLWFDLSHPEYKNVIDNIEKLNEVSPLTLDLLQYKKTINQDGSGSYWPDDVKMVPVDNRLSDTLQPFYFKSFITIVNETRFAQPTGNFSEKTFYAMKYSKPFILVAPPYTLEYIRSLGFKTFNDYFDESYDTIENHTDRMLAIYKLIDHIDSMSIDELKELNNKMANVLEHNYNKLIDFTFEKKLQDLPK